MAGKTKNRRTGGSGSVFQDSKGRWHFRKDMGTDPATGRRRPPIEATGMVKSEARARFQAKIAEWERDGRLLTKDGPKTADYFERWMEEHRTAVNPTTWRNESSWVQETAPHTQKQDRQHLSRSPRRHAPNRETGRTHRR